MKQSIVERWVSQTDTRESFLLPTESTETTAPTTKTSLCALASTTPVQQNIIDNIHTSKPQVDKTARTSSFSLHQLTARTSAHVGEATISRQGNHNIHHRRDKTEAYESLLTDVKEGKPSDSPDPFVASSKQS
jgi:hypothetical protein